MRFMMMMIPAIYQPKADGTPGPEPGFTPSLEGMVKMRRFNMELADAGALLSLDGLQPLAAGARVSYSGGKSTVTDGPFVETREVLGGFWIIDVASKEEAVAWAERIPAEDGDVVEVRRFFEMTDFPQEVLDAAQAAVPLPA
jgi:hypothetical protein